MTDAEFAISCGIYLRGDTLDPALITARLGIEPTKIARRGEVHPSKSKTQIVNRIGLWAHIVGADGDDFDSALEKLFATFARVDMNLLSLPGVQDGFLDIYGTADRTDGCDAANFALTSEQLERLAALGLSVEVSISIFDRTDVHGMSTALPNTDSDT